LRGDANQLALLQVSEDLFIRVQESLALGIAQEGATLGNLATSLAQKLLYTAIRNAKSGGTAEANAVV
jgi:hypothetical protein